MGKSLKRAVSKSKNTKKRPRRKLEVIPKEEVVKEKIKNRCVVESYDEDQGPSPEAMSTSIRLLEVIKNAYDKLINHESSTKERFSLEKFIYDFGRNLTGIINVQYPEIKDTFLDGIGLSKEQMTMIMSYMTSAINIPFAILLTEWYRMEHPEFFEDITNSRNKPYFRGDKPKKKQMVN